jgi:hypothetical protein
MAKYAAFGTAVSKAATEYINVSNISGPGISLDTEDVTSHDQATSWEEVVGTILRSGEMTLDLIYDPSAVTHNFAAGLIGDLVAKTSVEYVLTFPDAVTWTFNALVTGFEPSAPVGGALTATAKFKLTGAPTLV